MSESQQRVMFTSFEKKIDEMADRGLIFLDSVVDLDCTAEFSRAIMYMTMRKLDRPTGLGKQPIWIYLNSLGGVLHCGLAIHDMIRGVVEMGIEVNILGVGIVASMSAAIMQAGTKRYALPHTQFLIHQVSQTISGHEEVNEEEERVEETKRVNRIVMGIIADRTGMNLEELLKTSKKRDCWYSADDATRFGSRGLIDMIRYTLPILAV